MQSTTSAGDLIATTDDVIDVVDALSMPSPRRRGGRDAREQGPASGRSSREHETGISPAEACRDTGSRTGPWAIEALRARRHMSGANRRLIGLYVNSGLCLMRRCRFDDTAVHDIGLRALSTWWRAQRGCVSFAGRRGEAGCKFGRRCERLRISLTNSIEVTGF
jgi:hypothetical protein